jgi:hypothetical protein
MPRVLISLRADLPLRLSIEHFGAGDDAANVIEHTVESNLVPINGHNTFHSPRQLPLKSARPSVGAGHSVEEGSFDRRRGLLNCWAIRSEHQHFDRGFLFNCPGFHAKIHLRTAIASQSIGVWRIASLISAIQSSTMVGIAAFTWRTQE